MSTGDVYSPPESYVSDTTGSTHGWDFDVTTAVSRPGRQPRPRRRRVGGLVAGLPSGKRADDPARALERCSLVRRSHTYICRATLESEADGIEDILVAGLRDRSSFALVELGLIDATIAALLGGPQTVVGAL